MGNTAGPGLTAATSLASVGLSIAGTESSYEGAKYQAAGARLKAQGENAADQFQANELDRAAEYGDLKADQTGAQLTQRLNVTLGNIDAMRAAAHTDPSSPTGAAVRDFQESVGLNQKSITVSNILAQSRKQESEAAYLRVAGANALLAGDVAARGIMLGARGARLAGYSNAISKFGQGGGGGGGGGSGGEAAG